jgi:hypothetical protein
MNEKTTAIVGSLIREFLYRTLLAYVLLHVMAMILPMSARADSPDCPNMATGDTPAIVVASTTNATNVAEATAVTAITGVTDISNVVDYTDVIDAVTAQDLRYARAMDNYQENRWQAAFEQFAALADEGHGASARMAWQMWRHGPDLFGQTFAAGTFQRHHWRDVWRCANDPSGSRCSNLASNQ